LRRDSRGADVIPTFYVRVIKGSGKEFDIKEVWFFQKN
jgi:hypothetical protein